MTLRFIVARILRELIELAECDDDAELVDALHHALDVASPGCSTDPASSLTGKMWMRDSRSRSGASPAGNVPAEPNGRWGRAGTAIAARKDA